jgi:P4 family phage/plasmid primase-like protien
MASIAKDNLKIIKKNLTTPVLFKKTDYLDKACFSYNYKQYGSMETWELAWEKLKELPPNENIFHELILGERKVKPYLDIEWYTEKFPELMPDRVLMDIKELVISILKNEWGKDVKYNDIYVASCHRKKTDGYKNSFRLVVSTHPSIVFVNTNCAGYLARRIRKLCQGKFDEDIVDMSVYKKLQNIRLVGHSKAGEYVQMTKLNSADDDKEFIITNIDPQWEVLASPEQKDHKYKDIKNNSGIDFENPTIIKYVMEKIKAIHPTSFIERIDANKFIQLNYTDRDEICFCRDDIKHDRIGFFCYILNDLICLGCHSGNCVDYENKKIIKTLGSISSTEKKPHEAVTYNETFPVEYVKLKSYILDGSFGISNLFKDMYLEPKRIKWINDTKSGSTFYWDGNLWKHDEYSFVERLITSNIVPHLRKFQDSCVNKDENVSLDIPEEVSKQCAKIILKLNEGSNLLNIVRFLKPLINDFDFIKIKDIHPYLLSCKNGVVDLKTGLLRKCVPDDNMTKSLDVSYDEHSSSEEFDNFVKQITSDEIGEDIDLYNYVRWMIGYSIQGNPIKKTFFILYGAQGYNGKSMLLNIIKEVLGFYAVTMDKSVIINSPQKSGGSHSTEIIQLENSRFGMLTETSEDAVINDSQVKILTGITDKLSAREIYGKQKEFSPTFVPIISSNHKLKINLKDKAMYERCILIPFRLSFMEVPDPAKKWEKPGDPFLAEKFKNNKEGILKWLIECSLFYNSHMNLPVPDTILKAKEEYRKEMDDYADFIDRYMVKTDTQRDFVMMPDILVRYKEFAKESNIPYDRRKSEKMIHDSLGTSDSKISGYKFIEE